MANANHQITARCPICGNGTTQIKYKRQHHYPDSFSGSFSPVARDFGIFYDLHFCNEWEHLFANSENITFGAQYREAEDPGNYFQLANYRKNNLRHLVSKIRPYFNNKKFDVLDIGAGGGIFLSLLNELGIDSVGLEPCKQLVEIGREKFGVKLIEGTLAQENLPNRHFDLISLIEVIEHLENPRQELLLATKHLKASGMVLIVTPNIQSLCARILGGKWWSFRQMHIQYFSPQFLDRLMRSLGYRLIWSGLFTKSFPITYYLENLLPLKFKKLNSFSPCLKASLGDMSLLYKKSD